MNGVGCRLLVVEDDPSILQGLELALGREGYEVHTATDGDRGLEMARRGPWDLIVLDLMLPGRNGFEILATLREAGDDTPVLILSARTDEMDRIRGLDLGADDYVTKPFSLGELLARVRAMLRRRRHDDDEPLVAGPLTVDMAHHAVLLDGRPVDLTATEYQVLVLLVRARERVLSRRQILDAVWGPGHHGSVRTVDNFIAQLRAKLEVEPGRPQLIETVRGFGYRLAVRAEEIRAGWGAQS
ncbi:MAG TPA: response regulator transcription factor [Acidobacteria bacterium]|nr:response regulator transcription factor [Acidobacteriota bacterium]